MAGCPVSADPIEDIRDGRVTLSVALADPRCSTLMARVVTLVYCCHHRRYDDPTDIVLEAFNGTPDDLRCGEMDAQTIDAIISRLQHVEPPHRSGRPDTPRGRFRQTPQVHAQHA